MAATNDTIDGLLAEFRGYAAGMPDSYHVTMSWADFRKMLDRFDAAHKRERGDRAKLREALEDIGRIVEQIRLLYSDYPYETHLIARKASAALAAPPRNCDVGTAEEQEERYLKLKREHVDRMARCPAVGESFFFPDSLYWAQMPYETEEEV